MYICNDCGAEFASNVKVKIKWAEVISIMKVKEVEVVSIMNSMEVVPYYDANMSQSCLLL
jgi:hypothetical protein